MSLYLAKTDDVEELMADITRADFLEASITAPGSDLEEILTEAVDAAEDQAWPEVVYAFRHGSTGDLLALGGFNLNDGRAWFLTTNRGLKTPKDLLRDLKYLRGVMWRSGLTPHNIVMRTNRAHVRLIESLGGHFDGPIAGIGGEAFQCFTMPNPEGGV